MRRMWLAACLSRSSVRRSKAVLVITAIAEENDSLGRNPGESGVAYAGEATRGPTTMTDAEMDKVTAGVAYVNVYNPGEVYVTIFNNGQGPNPPSGLIVYPGYPHTSSRVCVNSCFN
jgi:hypothetical protein